MKNGKVWGKISQFPHIIHDAFVCVFAKVFICQIPTSLFNEVRPTVSALENVCAMHVLCVCLDFN